MIMNEQEKKTLEQKAGEITGNITDKAKRFIRRWKMVRKTDIKL